MFCKSRTRKRRSKAFLNPIRSYHGHEAIHQKRWANCISWLPRTSIGDSFGEALAELDALSRVVGSISLPGRRHKASHFKLGLFKLAVRPGQHPWAPRSFVRKAETINETQSQPCPAAYSALGTYVEQSISSWAGIQFLPLWTILSRLSWQMFMSPHRR
jgi:hypothetical protein